MRLIAVTCGRSLRSRVHAEATPQRVSRPSNLLWIAAILLGSITCLPHLKAADTAPVNAAPISVGRPPGRLINVSMHRLHLYCIGHGSPTVVMDAGLGGSALEWLPVQRRLTSHTRACTYDRAGYGWSDASREPRTSLQNARELHTLLTRGGIKPPYVLVGHSYGGLDMQLFASIFPKLMAGLVLVDSSHPGQVKRFEAEPIGVSTAPRRGASVLITQAPVPANIPANLTTTLTRLMSSRKTLSAVMDELRCFRVSAMQVLNAPRWPDVPVVVLTRGERVWPHDRQGDLMEALWMQLQTELATRSPHSLHIMIRRSGHHIHLDRPALVARAILMATDEYRDSPSLQATAETLPVKAYQVAHTLADDTLLSDLHVSR